MRVDQTQDRRGRASLCLCRAPQQVKRRRVSLMTAAALGPPAACAGRTRDKAGKGSRSCSPFLAQSPRHGRAGCHIPS